MNEPPKKKLRQSSILDLFGKRKRETSNNSVENWRDSQEDSIEIIDDIIDQEIQSVMSSREDVRAKTAAAAEQRKESGESPKTMSHKDDSSTWVNFKPSSAGKTNLKLPATKTSWTDSGVPSSPTRKKPAKTKAQSPEKEIPLKDLESATSSTLQYTPPLFSDSQSSEVSGDSSQVSISDSDQPNKSYSFLLVNNEKSEEKYTSHEITNGSLAQSKKSKNIPSSKPHAVKYGWRGCNISDLRKTPECSPKYPPNALKTSERHSVLVQSPVTEDTIPKPSYPTYSDAWDTHYVRLPCSDENLYPVSGPSGKKELQPRWVLIDSALSSLDENSNTRDIQRKILSYNSRYSSKWDFSGLHFFFDTCLEKEEQNRFFKQTLPAMVSLTLQIKDICTQPIPLLKRLREHSITLSQQQIACLLANAFFCTFPRRNAKKQSEYSSFPGINFNDLFQGTGTGIHPRKAEKLKCLINYFRRVTTKMPKGTVTFSRQYITTKDVPVWKASKNTITKLHVTADGTIEDQGEGMLQVDFANKYVGGGVLGHGCVQEEIRFLICPEMIVSRLFTEYLDHHECLIMTGCERFSSYDGYADSFEWKGDYKDKTPRDSWGRRYCQVVAIDALVFRHSTHQFSAEKVRRELNKAYCGFLDRQSAKQHLAAVATGNWGCGAFGGDLRLKALIQLMAASEVKRDVCYFTFGDVDLMDDLNTMHEFLVERKVALYQIWNLIQAYYRNICWDGASRNPKMNIFDYIYKVYNDCDTDTTEGSFSPPQCEDSQDLWGSDTGYENIEQITRNVDDSGATGFSKDVSEKEDEMMEKDSD